MSRNSANHVVDSVDQTASSPQIKYYDIHPVVTDGIDFVEKYCSSAADTLSDPYARRYIKFSIAKNAYLLNLGAKLVAGEDLDSAIKSVFLERAFGAMLGFVLRGASTQVAIMAAVGHVLEPMQEAALDRANQWDQFKFDVLAKASPEQRPYLEIALYSEDLSDEWRFSGGFATPFVLIAKGVGAATSLFVEGAQNAMNAAGSLFAKPKNTPIHMMGEGRGESNYASIVDVHESGLLPHYKFRIPSVPDNVRSKKLSDWSFVSSYPNVWDLSREPVYQMDGFSRAESKSSSPYIENEDYHSQAVVEEKALEYDVIQGPTGSVNATTPQTSLSSINPLGDIKLGVYGIPGGVQVGIISVNNNLGVDIGVGFEFKDFDRFIERSINGFISTETLTRGFETLANGDRCNYELLTIPGHPGKVNLRTRYVRHQNGHKGNSENLEVDLELGWLGYRVTSNANQQLIKEGIRKITASCVEKEYKQDHENFISGFSSALSAGNIDQASYLHASFFNKYRVFSDSLKNDEKTTRQQLLKCSDNKILQQMGHVLEAGDYDRALSLCESLTDSDEKKQLITIVKQTNVDFISEDGLIELLNDDAYMDHRISIIQRLDILKKTEILQTLAETSDYQTAYDACNAVRDTKTRSALLTVLAQEQAQKPIPNASLVEEGYRRALLADQKNEVAARGLSRYFLRKEKYQDARNTLCEYVEADDEQLAYIDHLVRSDARHLHIQSAQIGLDAAFYLSNLAISLFCRATKDNKLTKNGQRLQRGLKLLEGPLSSLGQLLAHDALWKKNAAVRAAWGSGPESTSRVLLNQGRYIFLSAQLVFGVMQWFKNEEKGCVELARRFIGEYVLPIGQIGLSAGFIFADRKNFAAGALAFSPDILLNIPEVRGFLMQPNPRNLLAYPRFIIGSALAQLASNKSILKQTTQALGYANAFSKPLRLGLERALSYVGISTGTLQRAYDFVASLATDVITWLDDKLNVLGLGLLASGIAALLGSLNSWFILFKTTLTLHSFVQAYQRSNQHWYQMYSNWVQNQFRSYNDLPDLTISQRIHFFKTIKEEARYLRDRIEDPVHRSVLQWLYILSVYTQHALEGSISIGHTVLNSSCFFDSVAYYCGVDYRDLRAQAAAYERTHREEFVSGDNPLIPEGEFDAHSEKITQEDAPATKAEIYALAKSLNRPIIILEPNKEMKACLDALPYQPGEFTGEPIFICLNRHGDNHYYVALLLTGEGYFDCAHAQYQQHKQQRLAAVVVKRPLEYQQQREKEHAQLMATYDQVETGITNCRQALTALTAMQEQTGELLADSQELLTNRQRLLTDRQELLTNRQRLLADSQELLTDRQRSLTERSQLIEAMKAGLTLFAEQQRQTMRDKTNKVSLTNNRIRKINPTFI